MACFFTHLWTTAFNPLLYILIKYATDLALDELYENDHSG